ncbi:MAG: hypothetical protein EHM23_27365 [Acidobacteria bacterium]|nr:MAG: hypothetical protein EHM23_27365 [Acidobacteriota bacterium]
MNRNSIVILILTATFWVGSADAGMPSFTSPLGDAQMREMDLLSLSAHATDTHQLAYVWSIVSDETNGQAFLENMSGASAELGVRWISSAAAGQLNGSKVTIKVVARHANPLDGAEEAETTATVTIQGVNHPPVAVISGKLGTPTDRIPTGYGVCADAYQISDPDGDGPRANWDFGARSGGKWQTPMGDLAPALFGSEGGRCCFTVLDMTAPIDQEIQLTLLDGLHAVKNTATCYLKPADAATTNQAPKAVIQYMVGSAAQAVAPATPVTIDTNTAIAAILKGDTSTDDGGNTNLTYTWTKQDSITAGSVSLASATGAATTLDIAAHTRGTVIVTLTAKDQGNLTGAATISFNLVDSPTSPIARASASVAGQVLAGPVDPGSVVTLDGSASSRPDASKTNLSYRWTQTEGPSVTITNADKPVAEFTTPAQSGSRPAWLKFQLIVKDGVTASDPAELTVDLSDLTFYFSQVAAGPLGTSEFRTSLLLVNGSAEAVSGVEVEFFDQDGQPMDVTLNGSVWNGAPFDIPALSSERLVVTGQDLKLGWARVKAQKRLTGLLLYQVVEGNNKDVQTQVGLYSTDAARKFATFYDSDAEIAIAVANPSGQAALVRVRVIDNQSGAEVVSKLLFPEETGNSLPALQHRAKFLNAAFLGQLPSGFSVGTLLVESDVPVTVTLMETKGGLVFSTLPVRTLR